MYITVRAGACGIVPAMNTTAKVCIALGLLFGIALSAGGSVAAPPMEKKAVYGESKPLGPYTPGIDVGDTVYLAGQIGIDPKAGKLVEGGIEAETRQTMMNAEAVLKNAGLGWDNVVKATVFLADLEDFQAMNGVYGSFFEGTTPPARSTVAVKAIAAGALVEIDFIAVR